MGTRVLWPATIGTLRLRNRLVRSATMEARTDNGRITESFVAMYRELAKGGVGLIITGMMAPSSLDNHLDVMLSLYTEEGLQDAKRLIDEVHRHGGKIMIQLSAVGSQQPEVYQSHRQTTKGPSGITEVVYGTTSGAYTMEELQTIGHDFVRTIALLKRLGADGVQIHGAHGYLLSHLLTPFYNRRQDGYGGSIVERGRLLLEIIREARSVIGKSYPLWIKINCDDFMEEGSFTEKDCAALLPLLERAGISAIEISGGNISSKKGKGVIQSPRDEEPQIYFYDIAKRLAKTVSIPVGIVGGVRDVVDAQFAIDDGGFAFVSMCRALINEPHLVKRWQRGDMRRGGCIRCNACLEYTDDGLYCIMEKDRPKGKHRRV